MQTSLKFNLWIKFWRNEFDIQCLSTFAQNFRGAPRQFSGCCYSGFVYATSLPHLVVNIYENQRCLSNRVAGPIENNLFILFVNVSKPARVTYYPKNQRADQTQQWIWIVASFKFMIFNYFFFYFFNFFFKFYFLDFSPH